MPFRLPARFHLTGLLLIISLTMLAGCVHRDSTAVSRWADARQMVLVVIPDWNADHGTLRTFARQANSWREVSSAAPVTIGKAGAAWGSGLNASRADGPIKREGDNRSPAGVFPIGQAFGYAASADTALPYRALSASDYCVDVSGSPQYNRIVDASVVGAAAVKGSTEPMRRDLHAHGDQRYRLGFVIEQNASARAMAGSCIFAHLWKSSSEATAGCTAMTSPVMQRLLAWLQPQQQPIFVLLPQGMYERLRDDWQLPVLAASEVAP